jgi:hypothetical protein
MKIDSLLLKSVTVDVTDDSGSMDQEKKANRRDFD